MLDNAKILMMMVLIDGDNDGNDDLGDEDMGEEEENLGLSINSLMLGGFLSIFYLFAFPSIPIV